jgi:hypothetical protein
MTRATEATSQSSCTHSPCQCLGVGGRHGAVLHSCADLVRRWRVVNARSISSTWPLLVLQICWLTASRTAKFSSEDPLRYLRIGYPPLHRCLLGVFSNDKPSARLQRDYYMAAERHSERGRDCIIGPGGSPAEPPRAW